MLLRFRVSNHRSLRDEQELSLVAVPRRGEQAAAGPIPPTVRVAGIYGANASGKSNVLHALGYFFRAVRDSYAQWGVAGGIPRQPFLLDPAARNQPSMYEIDIASDGIRYTYGFRVNDERVCLEWLHSYHARSRKRVLFRREKDEFYFGRSLSGPNAAIARLVRKNALYLSVAAASSHPMLGPLCSELGAHSQEIVELGQGHPKVPILARLALAYDQLRPKVDSWLRFADLGISGSELEKPDLTDEQSKWWNERAHGGGGVEDKDADELARNAYFGKLRLLHGRGPKDAPVALPFESESTGTQIWLAVLVEVEPTLRWGGVALVDEVDSSLHPRLSAALIQMFKDPVINPKNAQLIFTSHDVSLLGGLIEDEILSRDEVWFTEKGDDGATAMFPLSDFHPRRGENFERAYLQGRYGAVPYVDIAELRRLFDRKVPS
ncbi:MAG TPA: ATP-binding protein [Actinophytocola sp.]|uniref:AAA family ATPase n=1 Tax=Actinophytocola sp. TaxID=1872138 RepID=UPI002DDD3D3D|nr:ATP-binding protein [Actinophytocola sp.]HEV2779928.1 ATP-binding protein [Actinophytocola sp.]